MFYQVKYVAYICPTPQSPPSGTVERLADGSVIYYLSCGVLSARGSKAILRGQCRPEELGLDGCRIFQQLVVVTNVRIKDEFITDAEGRVSYITIVCGGRKRMALYYPARGTLVLLAGSAPVEECVDKLRLCL